MVEFLRKLFTDDQGQDIAEYAVMLAVILVLVIGTVRLIGGNANNAFSTVASSRCTVILFLRTHPFAEGTPHPKSAFPAPSTQPRFASPRSSRER